MTEVPKFLTATVHIRFHYAEPEERVAECNIAMMDRLLEHAADLPPVLQELLVKFANYLKNSANETTR